MKELFFSLLNAQSEKEVHTIIQKHPLLKEQENWKPYGGTMGNYSSFENQQSTAEGALMEKITNSIDAILVRQSHVKGIHPESPDAPQTMEDAVDHFFTPEEMANEHVKVLVDGDVKSPNILIVDEGEGQEPDAFETTLLSLQRGNKNKIKFVQGKFNMGSTGAAVFCGIYKYQLIASKRHSIFDGSEDIGFTIIRKHVRNKEEEQTMKNTWYEYFVVKGDIPRFQSNEVKLSDDERERFSFKEGTIVKLFNYQLAKRSSAFQTLKEEINSHLYFPAFPIQVVETRKGFKLVKERNSIMNIAYGNGNLLRGGISAKLEEMIEYRSLNNTVKSPVFGEAKVDIFLFKEEYRNEAKQYRSSKPIVFLMNGQVQYHKETNYISSVLDLKLIKDHVVISIDCTHLNKDFLDEGFFMANRETIRNTERNQHFLAAITDFLKSESKLKDFNKIRSMKKASSSSAKQLFEKLLGKAKNQLFRNLFQPHSTGSNTKYNSHLTRDSQRDSKELFEFPTYMKLKNVKKDENEQLTKVLPMGKKAKFTVELDAVDNYFTRNDDTKGQLTVKVFQDGQAKGSKNAKEKNEFKDVTDWFSLSKSSMEHGEVNVAMSASSSEIQIGESYIASISVEDKENNFEQFLYIKIEEPAVKDPSESKNKAKEKLILPPVIQVFRDQSIIDSLPHDEEERKWFETWESLQWDLQKGREKVIEIIPGIGNQLASAIYINMNSAVLEQIIVEEGTTGTKVALANEQYLMSLYSKAIESLASFSLLQKEKDQEETYGVNLTSLNTEMVVESLIKCSAYAIVKMQLNNLRNATA